MADKKFSELTTASEIKNSDYMAISQDTGSGLVSLKATILAIANKIVSNINFTSALQTNSKTITGAINEIAQGGGGGGASTEIIADDFDATSTYAVGDYVVYDGKLYKCTTAVSTAGQWDANDWTETIVMDEVEQGGGGGTTVVANPSGTATADLIKLQVGNNIYGIPSGGGGSWTDVTGTLTAGNTSITLSDASIETTSTIDFYTNEFGVNPTDVSVSAGSVTLTFEAQSTDLGVKIRVTNGSGGGGSDTHEYSTTEKVVGKWIDGSDVYEKTLYYAGGVNGGSCSFAHNISNFGRLISIEGSAHDNYESGTDLPLPKIDPNGYHIGIQAVDSTNITYVVPSVYSARIIDLYVTLRYTKSQS